MSDVPAPTTDRPALTVVAVEGGEPAAVVERWREAVEHALAASPSLSSWRIVVDPDDALPGPGEVVLTLAMDTVILPSTVERLVAARENASARELPLGRASSVSVHVHDGASAPAPHPEAAVARIPWAEPPSPQSGAEALVVEAVSPVAGAKEEVLARLSTSGVPLLSVVMRTQGARLEALRDCLLTLAAQADGRFELVLVVHDAPIEPVSAVVADMPPWLTSRTRVVTAAAGTRSVPLNVGISMARGTHVAFLDDDDVVTGAWVSTFLAGVAVSPRSLLRAVAGVQRVASAPWAAGVEGHEVDPEVTEPYPAVFDLADHLRVNLTPFMALAFPRGFFGLFGGADESLEVCEDWDLLLRAASVLGVTDLRGMTAVYRRWSSGGDSYTTHASEAWLRDMRAVRAKIDRQPIVLAPGSASELADLSALRDVRVELDAVRSSTSWRVTRPLRALMDAVTRARGGR